MEGHPYAQRLSDNEFCLVAELFRMNMAPRDILSVIKQHFPNNVSSLSTIYNAIKKIRMMETGGKSPMQVLMSILHSSGYTYYYTTATSNELENLFFIHPISFNIWRAYPHVLIIDATYKTNRYKMPFVKIVGVTSTSKTFCIAFAFIHDETTVRYEWVLNCLKLTLGECMLPRVIVTDREMALINACRGVFPDAARLFCRWHIRHNIIDKWKRSFKRKDDWTAFYDLWTLLEGSSTLKTYTGYYKQLESFLKRLNLTRDGNCGYRAFAVSLMGNEQYYENIRYEMKEELQNKPEFYKSMFDRGIKSLKASLCYVRSPCPPEYWMMMPHAGILIANRFGVIVHSLSMSESSTIFPFWMGPEEFQEIRVLTIALVNCENHYVTVELQGDYPMPPVTGYFHDRYITTSAARWKEVYKERFEQFIQFNRREADFVDLND
ncbi:uncharacterized protein [Rutidosis leptorrhynchoides]|uniref:uncharacterized protein n=1 Tax=Rutidosis leptorrhynchoides TaxID=125765 RepID=UPI003A9A3A3E